MGLRFASCSPLSALGMEPEDPGCSASLPGLALDLGVLRGLLEKQSGILQALSHQVFESAIFEIERKLMSLFD